MKIKSLTGNRKLNISKEIGSDYSPKAWNNLTDYLRLNELKSDSFGGLNTVLEPMREEVAIHTNAELGQTNRKSIQKNEDYFIKLENSENFCHSKDSIASERTINQLQIEI